VPTDARQIPRLSIDPAHHLFECDLRRRIRHDASFAAG
jgi:hypothetical protein